MTPSQVFFTIILCSPHASPYTPPYLFYKIFLKIQVHLFFGCFVVCIYCIDSVTSVTFYRLPTSKKYCYFLHWKPFETNGKCFLFYLKSSLHSEDISVFVTTFWSCRENGLIRRIRLTSKFMASQPGLQTIVIHILLNISQSKGNQTMKFGQLIEYNKRNIFLQKVCRKWGKETSSKPLSLFIKV